jgi:hypothetical protein
MRSASITLVALGFAIVVAPAFADDSLTIPPLTVDPPPEP